MKNVCYTIAAVSIFIALGIVGGVEHGQPLSNMLWAVLCIGITWLSAIIAENVA